jgi:hypothetical protein
MGYAAIEYFESGGDVRGLAEKVREARDNAVAAASRRRRRGEPAEVIPATAWVEDDGGAPDTVQSLPSAAPEQAVEDSAQL